MVCDLTAHSGHKKTLANGNAAAAERGTNGSTIIDKLIFQFVFYLDIFHEYLVLTFFLLRSLGS
jgi:hypothetical protein